MPKIVVTRRLFDEALGLIKQTDYLCYHNHADKQLSADQIAQVGDGAEALVCLLTDRVDGELMDRLPRLKVIANVAVGYDNIDLQAATDRRIAVTNTPDVLTECTADLAFALLLAAARRLVEADSYMRAGKFMGWELFQPHLGVDVFGKTLGIIGLGRIGAAVARRAALGFGMRILYTSRGRKPELEQALGLRQVAFDQLLQQSDFISIHTPLTPDTHHLFSRREFEQMKPTAFLINTARGPIVDEAALVSALADGLVQGAALDVFEDEPRMHPGLADFKDRVVVVPHIGSATVETRRRMSIMAVQNALAALSGVCPPNILNPEVWR